MTNKSSCLCDGFYLAAYLGIDKIANVYDIKMERHDQNISLWEKKGEKISLIHYWELERLTRNKHHEQAFFSEEQAKNVINQLLKPYGLSLNDIIEIWGTPKLSEWSIPARNSKFTYHSLCHIFSSVLMNTDIFYNENILALSVDLGSDYETEPPIKQKEYTGCVVKKGKIQFFHIESPGALWAISAREHKMGEGTLMALASATNCKLRQNLITNQLTMFSSEYEKNKDVYDSICNKKLLDECKTEEIYQDINCDFSIQDNMTSAEMKLIQEFSENVMIRQIKRILKEHNMNPIQTYLSVSGGFGLNCPTNSKLMKQFKFKGFLAPPCINDSGQSLGIALYHFYERMPKLNFRLEHAYYGERFSDIYSIIDSLSITKYIKSITKIDMKQAVNDIITNPIVWFDGAAEIGPRALGHRSILADPRYVESKQKLNTIKQRQQWRPVAPIILESDINDWFEDAHSSPFMLHTFSIKKECLPLLQAIVHPDGTARIQTVSPNTDERLYQLLQTFKVETGVPILCNTSLNDKYEPIINRPDQALHFCLKKGIHIVYINGIRVELKNHATYQNELELAPDIDISAPKEKRERVFSQCESMKLTKDILSIYYWTSLKDDYDINNPIDAKIVRRVAEVMIKNRGVENILIPNDYY